jgi:FkbM family methyltransferase
MDIGLHHGDDTARYLAQGYRVVAVEADPRHVEAAHVRFAAGLAAGDLIIEPCGLGPDEGEFPFYRNLVNDQLSSFDYDKGHRSEAQVDTLTVACRHPRFLFETYGMPHYLKIDIEGADRCVLDALAERPDRPTFISCEVNDVSEIDAMIALGFSGYMLVEQSQYIKAGGAPTSGPFGDALPGAWTDGATARQQYVTARDRGDLRGPKWNWFDLHARAA